MKNVFLVLSAAFLFSFVFPRVVSADCIKQYPGVCGHVKCSYNGTWYCCTTQQECDNLKNTPIQNSLNLDQIQANAFPGNTIPTNIGSLIGSILPYIFGAAGLALLIYLVLGGLQIMTSRGDPKAMQSAQAKITNAVIGFIIVIFAFVIVQLFGRLFGLQGTLFSQIFGGT